VSCSGTPRLAAAPDGGGRLAPLLQVNHGTLHGWVRHLVAQGEYLAGRLDPFLRLDAQHTRRLVFVCLGNLNRSAFAAAVARRQGVDAVSFGLAAQSGAPAYALAQDVARELDVDLGSHLATDLMDYEYRQGDVLVAMEVRHARRLRNVAVPMAPVLLLGHWCRPRRLHLQDPHQLAPDYFRSCFTLIQSGTVQLVRELRAAGSPCVRG
jgi:protein-tyrosine phosphatase